MEEALPSWVSRRGLLAAGTATCAIVLLMRKRTRKPVVCEINVYPVKSCAQVSMSSEKVLSSGFEHDRLFQVTNKKGKFVTPRDDVGRTPGPRELFKIHCVLDLGVSLTLCKEGMKPLVINLRDPAPEVFVTVLGEARPNENKEKLLDYGDAVALWLQDAIGLPGCRLHGVGPNYARMVVMNPEQGDAPVNDNCPVSLADEAPFLLTSRASLSDLRRQMFWKGDFTSAFRTDMRRYRPNIVIDGLLPWEEDTWKRIRIGDIEFLVWQRCGRCSMTTFDRDSLKPDGALAFLRSVRSRPNANDPSCTSANFGMHLIPISGTPAPISCGDTLEILERDEAREKEWVAKFGPTWRLGLKFGLGLSSA